MSVRVAVAMMGFLTCINSIVCEDYYIIPSENFPCPFNSCLTLTAFASTFNTGDSNNNTTLNMFGGNHTLTQVLGVQYVHEFVIQSVDNTHVSTNVLCNSNQTPDVHLQFENIENLYIRGVTFIGCGGNRLESVYNASIRASRFIGQSHTEAALVITDCNASIDNTHFISNQVGLARSDSTLLGLLTSSNTQSVSTMYTAGGAIFINSSTVLIDRCQFMDNQAHLGGAIFSQKQSNITISNSSFTSNQATKCNSGLCFGGSMFAYEGSLVVIDNTTFVNTTSDQDGGLATLLEKATLVVTNSIIENSSAHDKGGAFAILSKSNLTLQDTRIERSHANNDGGAIYAERLSLVEITNNCIFLHNTANKRGGVAFIQQQSRLTIDDSTVQNNTATAGAVVFLEDNANGCISNSNFSSNIADQHGGVVFMTGKSVCTIVSSIFNLNKAEHGGVMYIRDKGNSLQVNQSSFTFNRAGLNGGAIHLQFGSKLIIDESSFSHNVANRDGGAIYGLSMEGSEVYRTNFTANKANIGGAVTIRDGSTFYATQCLFTNNTDVDLGAVIFSDYDTITNVTSSIFSNNAANYGGVSHSTRNSIVKIINCTYINNIANIDGATIYGRARSFVAIINSTFINNIAINDAVVLVYDSSSFNIDNVFFYNNRAGHDGGAVYVYKSSLSLTNASFISNRAENSGGSIYARSNTNIFINMCTFSSNTAQTSGGAVHIQQKSNTMITSSNFSSSSANSGGVLYVYVNSSADIVDCTFNDSTAYQDGGVVSVYNNSTLTVDSSIFMSNVGDYAGVTEAFQNSSLTFVDCELTNNSAAFEGIVRLRQNSTLNITRGTFTHNSAENGGVIFTQRSSAFIDSSNFSFNNASKKGGVIYSNVNSTILVRLCMFSDNKADNDGGVMSFQNETNIIVDTCTFTRSSARSHGGCIGIEFSKIRIWNSNLSLSVAGRGGGNIRAINSTIELFNSSFNDNNASTGGGVIHARTQSKMLITGCEFYDNFAGSSGGALLLEDSKANITSSSFERNTATKYGGAISITSSEANVTGIFRQNLAQCGGAIHTVSSHLSFVNTFNQTSEIYINNNTAEYQGGGIHMKGSNLLINAHTEIINNIVAFIEDSQFNSRANLVENEQGGNSDYCGGAIYASEVTLTFGSTVDFVNNYARCGGALYLNDSTFQDDLTSNEHKTHKVNFVSNRAQQFGGSIFVNDNQCSLIPGSPPCFFKYISNLRINFTDRIASSNATNSGDNLYGGLLDRCIITSDANRSQGIARFKNVSDDVSLNTIRSQPVRVCPCTNNKPDCDKRVLPVEVKQGNGFTIGPIVAIDQVGHPLTSTVNSYFNESGINTLLQANQMTQTVSSSCSNLTYQISFPNAPATYDLIVYADGPCTNTMKSQFIIEVKVERCSCPIGFTRETRGTTCTCHCDIDETFSSYVNNCSVSKKSIVREGRFWITYLNSTGQYLIYDLCPLDYCVPPSPGVFVNLNLPNGSNSQCANDRSGLLCGQCSSNDNLSLSLGSTSCIRCPDEWYAIVIGIVIAASFAGVGLVALILLFNITVAVGTLNSIIFYANIIFANRSVYFRQLSLTYVPVFISWLNLEIGIDTCFYNGMDAYAKTWLQLAFPLYMIFLVLLIIVISSLSSKFSNLLGKRNPVATLATLILLSYTKLFEVIVASLSYVTLNYPNGDTEVRWLPDASVAHFQGKHIALIVIAILIDGIGFIYTILLTTWQWLVRFSRFKIFCCVRNQKLNSFVDAYHSPHTPKHRYWTGLLLLVRVVIYLISSFSLSVDPRIGLLSTVIIVSTLLSYKTTLMIKTYKNRLLNAIESFVYFNIITFTLLTWYTFDDSQTKINENKKILQTIAAHLSVGTMLIIFLGVIAFHVYRYGSSKVYSIGQRLKLGQKMNSLVSDKRNDGILDDIELLREKNGYKPPLQSHTYPLRSEISMAECEESPVEQDIHHQNLDVDRRCAGTRSSNNIDEDSSGVSGTFTLPRSQTLPLKIKASRQNDPKLLTFSYKGTGNESITVPLLEEDNL